MPLPRSAIEFKNVDLTAFVTETPVFRPDLFYGPGTAGTVVPFNTFVTLERDTVHIDRFDNILELYSQSVIDAAEAFDRLGWALVDLLPPGQRRRYIRRYLADERWNRYIQKVTGHA